MLRINMNGSTKADTMARYIAALDAIDAAMKALQEIKPHGRDYQTAPMGEYENDMNKWINDFAGLDRLRNAIHDDALAINGQ